MGEMVFLGSIHPETSGLKKPLQLLTAFIFKERVVSKLKD